MAYKDDNIADAQPSGQKPESIILPFLQNPLRILVSWQPGVAGTEAIETAAWLARVLPVRIRAVSTLLRLWPTTSLSKLGSRYDSWFEHETAAYAQLVREEFLKAGISEDYWDDEVAVVADGPSESGLLSEQATEFGAGLLIVGSQAAAPKGRFLAGSTTDALLHSSPTPLALAPRSVKLSKRGVTRVNVAYLGTRPEEDSLALYLGGKFADSLGVPLRLVAFSPTGLTNNSLDDRINLTRELSDQWFEHTLGLLDRARDRIIEELPDLEVHTELGSGSGWSGAVDALKWKKGDLLCISSSARGPIERVFLGSTEAQFVQHVSVPVIIHPAMKPA